MLISMKVPDDLLASIDSAAKSRGISRTALLLERFRAPEPERREEPKRMYKSCASCGAVNGMHQKGCPDA